MVSMYYEANRRSGSKYIGEKKVELINKVIMEPEDSLGKRSPSTCYSESSRIRWERMLANEARLEAKVAAWTERESNFSSTENKKAKEEDRRSKISRTKLLRNERDEACTPAERMHDMRIRKRVEREWLKAIVPEKEKEAIALLKAVNVKANRKARNHFQLWIEEHRRRILSGGIPSREEYRNSQLGDRQWCDGYDMLDTGKKINKDWDLIYGPNCNFVFAERVLREPGVKLAQWQKTKDWREARNTKQLPGLEEKRKRKNEETKQLDRDWHRTKYADEKKKAGQEVRVKKCPEEQKNARREADRLRKQRKREDKKDLEE
jgi:hypothetical protein